MTQIKEGDIIRYPLGFHSLEVRKVYKDENGELYIYEYLLGNMNGDHYVKTVDGEGRVISACRRHIYRKTEGYSWNNSLCREMGFGLASDKELHFLIDYDIREHIRDSKIDEILK